MSEGIIENENEQITITNDKSSNSKIVIVGNGFDLSVGLKSSYNNFVEHIKIEEKLETNEDIYNFNKLFLQKFDGKSLNWNDLESIFENHIREINDITYNNDDEIRSRYSVSEINAYLKEIEELFSSYLSNFYEKWLNSYRIRRNNNSLVVNKVYENIFKNADVINFNYTKTLSDLGLVRNGSNKSSRYFQIHGTLVENNIIFGGGFTGSEEFGVFNVPGSMDNDKLIRIKKDTYLFEKRTQLLDILNSYQESSVDTYIIGHSIYGSDLPFLSRIFEKSKRIYLFYYDNDYLIKLQKISKVLDSNILEKIVLVPFYDILVNAKEQNLEFGCNNSSSIHLDNNDIELLERVFNISLPTIDPFDEFILTNKLFIFNQFQYLKITDVKECESLKKILNFLDIKERDIEGLRLIVDGIEATVNDELYLDELLDMHEFKKCIKNSQYIEITRSSLSLEKMVSIISIAEKCKNIKISDCTIYCKDSEISDIDISSLQKIEYLEISKNNISDMQIVNIIASNNKISATLKKIVIRENSNLKTDHSLLNFAKNSRYIELDYPNNSEFGYDIHFPNVSTFILDAQEVDIEPVISGITLTPNIRALKLLEISLTKNIDTEDSTYKFSSLFKFEDNNENKNTKYLPNLKEIELSIIDSSRKLLFDIIPSTQQITFNGEQMGLIELWVKEQQEKTSKQKDRETKISSSKEVLPSESDSEISVSDISSQQENLEDNLDINNCENSELKDVKYEITVDETVNKVSKMILDYLSEYKLLHSDDSVGIKKKVATEIEKEISEFAEIWAVDKEALTFYILNFDTRKMEGGQLGETKLRESANYEKFPEKKNKKKLQYRRELNTVIREFAYYLHKKYTL